MMRLPVVILFAVLSFAASGGAQNVAHFYDTGSEIRVEGSVRNIRFEPRYEGTAPFLILDLEEKTSGRLFQVEVSPAWFFSRDIHAGEPVKILGSLISKAGQPLLLMAREVQAQGETIAVRDRSGFPNWRGGAKGTPRRKRDGRP
jgi:hypothetical protein